ncbi:LPXTG-motif cell wall anchor domain-containing protein [Glycomyces sambucus]|uniref:LPXTG-motif cell wall anchor domain-containing protein n=1 Tax=Glycomyces sambucus TaxID=380244 RepID=A0A1G9LGF5_9ACTN|nr:LPXTG cell wall anchor domain-containing protein [Glycomyces sambucus]SDL60976.1 LPXTG-motif cell wall anchor domain-containing protein [Glycomyces sambucus]
MRTPFDRAGRLAAALAALLAASAAGAGAFAPPAAAQNPAPSSVVLDLDGPLVAGGTPRAATLDVAFDEDPTGPLVMALDVDAPDSTVYFGQGAGCHTYDPSPYIECEIEEAGTANAFGFAVAAATGTELGEYDYTLTIYYGAVEVHTETGTVEVVEERYEGVFTDYAIEDTTATGVGPGAVVDVNPRFSAGSAFPGDLYATVLWFGTGLRGMGAEGVRNDAPWDNCTPNIWETMFDGYFCFFLDFEDSPGTAYQLSEPIPYTVDANAPGPLAVCGCGYHVFALNEETYERDFGELSWDEGSANLIELVTAADQGAVDGDDAADLVIETTANPYDLTVAGADLGGGEVEVTVPIGNDGPAMAAYRPEFEAEPSFLLRGQLPEGAQLVSVAEVDIYGWRCLDDSEIDDRREALEAGSGLDRIDFACVFNGLDPGESIDVVLTIDTTDATGRAGRIEVDAFYRGVDGVNLDGDMSNNAAALTVDDRSLPNTGNSSIVFIAVAAGAVVIGVVLFLITRRREQPAAAPDLTEDTGATGPER